MINKPLILFQGPVKSRSGYGDHTRDLITSLISMDKYDIKIAATKWGDCPESGLEFNSHRVELESRILTSNQLDREPDVYINCSVPNEFRRSGKFNIGITAGIETTAADASWIQGCNLMDLIIVPSKHSKDVLLSSVYDKIDEKTQKKIGELRLEKPIEVLFEGADLNIFKQLDTLDHIAELDEKVNTIPEEFCYLYVGHWLNGKLSHDRKDTGMLVKTFCKAFDGAKNQPALVLKTSMATFSIIDRNMILDKVKEIRDKFDNPPNVYIIHGDLTAEEVNGLYNHPKVKAHISFTKGEGFGRPLLEASISGKPVIASAWSGQLDFLNPDFTTLLPGDLQNVHKSAQWKGVINEGSKWFYVNYNIAETVIRDLFSNYDRYKKLGEQQAQYSIDNFSLSKMKELFAQLIGKYVGKISTPEHVQLKLPKLKKLNTKTAQIKLPKLKKM